MAMNKYMHSRNIYRTPPDFNKLAKEYPEFSAIAKLEVNSKVCIDFKDPHALRVLTKCLLQADFNLKVEIPEDRLVPTLPLRLNYILWVEDLMNAIKVTAVRGVDIGTGACAIYPLLGAVKNKWHMVGTESDEFSAQIAKKNKTNNNLDQFIEIIQTSSPTLVQHLFSNEDKTKYNFCMCNPPFYSSMQELYESRSPARPPPKNGFTGSPQELITDGGELEFIRKLIAESKNLQDNIQIYTTMVGHKYNLKVLLEDLKSDNILHTYTEFCQGRITRWGLAWTLKQYNLETMVPPNDKHVKKPHTPISYILPPLNNLKYDLDSMYDRLINIFAQLEIHYKVVNRRSYGIFMDVVAKTNTWSNQRKRKRLLKRLEEEGAKKTKMADDKNLDDCNKDNLISDISINNENLNKKTADPIVHALSNIVKRGKDFFLEFEYINGSGGKEGVHQVTQYIKNNWI